MDHLVGPELGAVVLPRGAPLLPGAVKGRSEWALKTMLCFVSLYSRIFSMNPVYQKKFCFFHIFFCYCHVKRAGFRVK